MKALLCKEIKIFYFYKQIHALNLTLKTKKTAFNFYKN